MPGKQPEIIEVDPRTLYLPSSRSEGADPTKLARQISKYGKQIDGMPSLQLLRGKDGHLRINDGVTRATRVAKLLPGTLIKGEVIENRPNVDVTRCPKVGDKLP